MLHLSRLFLKLLNSNNWLLIKNQWRSYSSAKAFFDALEKFMMCDDALEFLKLFAHFLICAHIYNKDLELKKK